MIYVDFTHVFVIFLGENLGEFRIRGLQIGLYLRNISNENLGVDRFTKCDTKTVCMFVA